MKNLLIISCLLGLAACGNPPYSKLAIADCSIQDPSLARLVSFGDSQTQGKQAHVGNCQYSYAYQMAKDLNLNIVNRAIGGSTLLDQSVIGPAQFEMIMTTEFQPTDTVVFMPGFNDITRYGKDPVALARFQSILNGLLIHMSGQVDHIYLATPLTMFNYSISAQGSPEAFALYVQAIKDAAVGVPNVTVLETTDLFEMAPTDVMDQIHINSKAQERLGYKLLDNIRRPSMATCHFL